MVKPSIAPCGLNCEECRVHIATLTDDTETLIQIGQEWGKSYNRPIAAEEVMCDGCRNPSNRVWLGCRECGLRLCEQSREIMTCIHCADFPCAKTKEFEAKWGTDHLSKAHAALKNKS